MRDKFPGYYRPSAEDFVRLWEKDAVFAFDANVLLNLYRYSDGPKKKLLGLLELLKDRIWLPHQAAFEFHSNRPNVILEQEGVYQSVDKVLREALSNVEDQLKNILKPDRHPLLDPTELISLLKTGMNDVTARVQEGQAKHPELLEEDPIRRAVEELFEGKVGDPYDRDRINEIKKRGQDRFKNKIPPGYEDGEKDEPDRYGDLILWFQVTDFAKERKVSIVFITDDRKKDWWWRVKGQTLGPRPELVEEIYEEAGVSYYQYSPESFMKYAVKHLGYQIDDETIDEVRRVAERSPPYGHAETVTIRVPSALRAASEEERRLEEEKTERRYRTLGRVSPAALEGLLGEVIRQLTERAEEEIRDEGEDEQQEE